jgi:hypothetical protein
MSRIHLETPDKQQLAVLLQASISDQLKVIERGIEKTQKNIERFEKQFHMSSDEFYQAYLTGTMGDEECVMQWAGEVETLRKLRQDYSLLKETEICS